MSHYSHAQEMKDLRPAARKAARVIYKEFKDTSRCPALCYSGMSGVAMATAVAMYLDMLFPGFKFNMYYVRKDKERSHGTHIEYECEVYGENNIGIFVDDFIDSGSTAEYVIKETMEHSTDVQWNEHSFALQIHKSYQLKRNIQSYIEVAKGNR